MNKTLAVTLLILVISVLIAAAVVSRTGEDAYTPLPTPTPVTNTNSLPPEFTSGDSRFSQGTCTTNEDCTVSGCSGEVCGNEEMITTCEYSEDFPSEEKYNCGCVENVCGWSK